MADRFQILSLDGGGIKGIFSAAVPQINSLITLLTHGRLPAPSACQPARVRRACGLVGAIFNAFGLEQSPGPGPKGRRFETALKGGNTDA